MVNGTTRTTRRNFLQAAVAAGTTLPLTGNWTTAADTAADKRSANEKLNLAVIGVAGRGASNLAGVAGENIVALCDIDSNRLAAAAAKHKQATTTDDFRRVLDIRTSTESSSAHPTTCTPSPSSPH